jgi:hypothetical protein
VEREQWSIRFDSPEPIDDSCSYPWMLENKFRPLDRESLKLQMPSDATTTSEMQREDHHNVLADQHHEIHVYSFEKLMTNDTKNRESDLVSPAAPKPPPKDPELVPRPLSWRKESEGSSPGRSTLHESANVAPSSDSRKRYRRMLEWVPLHKWNYIQERPNCGYEDQLRPANGSAIPLRDRLLKREIHLSNLLSHVKDFMFPTKEPKVRLDKVSDTTFSSFSPAIPSTLPPLEKYIPLLHFPGGFTLVRQSPTSTPEIERTDFLEISSPLEASHWDPSYTDFLEFPYPMQPTSLHSQHSQDLVAPSMAVKNRSRTSFDSSPSPQSRSNVSLSPRSPLAHEVALPHTPPSLPRFPKSPPLFSSLSQVGTEVLHDNCADSGSEDEPYRRRLHVGFLDRARDACDAWKGSNRDSNHDKLKQSIRVLGPTDPTIAAGYVRREGKMSVDDGAGSSRMPGYMTVGPLGK